MSNNPYISSENNANFICRTNGDIIINKVENPKNHQNNQAIDGWDKFSEPYLFRKWHPSQLRGYVSEEFRCVELVD